MGSFEEVDVKWRSCQMASTITVCSWSARASLITGTNPRALRDSYTLNVPMRHRINLLVPSRTVPEHIHSCLRHQSTPGVRR